MWLRQILRAHIVRPYNLNKPDGGGGVLDAPFRPRRGQSGEGHKSVKKNAALLHFLAFLLLDHKFGVLRGERLAAKTMAASLLRKPARAVIRPAGANIARSPVSPRSTVAPCSQPRNPLRPGLPRFRK